MVSGSAWVRLHHTSSPHRPQHRPYRADSRAAVSARSAKQPLQAPHHRSCDQQQPLPAVGAHQHQHAPHDGQQAAAASSCCYQAAVAWHHAHHGCCRPTRRIGCGRVTASTPWRQVSSAPVDQARGVPRHTAPWWEAAVSRAAAAVVIHRWSCCCHGCRVLLVAVRWVIECRS